MRADCGAVLAVLGAITLAAATLESARAAAEPHGSELVRALQEGDMTRAATLIGRLPVNARDEMGATPLMWAAQRASAALTAQLLQAGADPNICGGDELCPLHIAVENGAAEVTLLLLAHGARVNARRANGESALMTAARTGQIGVMHRLLELKADVNAHENRFHQTALMWSVAYAEEVRLLIAHGANVHARTRTWSVTNNLYRDPGVPFEWSSDGVYVTRKGGESALFFAVRRDNLESVQALLGANTDVNETSADGSTALLVALNKWESEKWQNHDELSPRFTPNLALANLLLDRGARVNVVDAIGYTPLHGVALSMVPQAQTLRYAPSVKLPPPRLPADQGEALALARRLVSMGANVHAVTRYPMSTPNSYFRLNPARPGYSPLHIAVLGGNVELVQLLLAHGADPNLVAQSGHNPLSLAIKANDLPVVTTLVAHGADPKRLFHPVEVVALPSADTKNAQPSGPRRNQTALHIAAGAKAAKVIAFLAEQGVALEAQNDHGETPLALAESQERLHEADVDVNAKPRDTATSTELKKLMQNRMQVSSAATGP